MKTTIILIYITEFLLIIPISKMIVSWFWRIEENIKLHQETNRLLNKIANKLDYYDSINLKEVTTPTSDIKNPKTLIEIIEDLKNKQP